MRHDERDIETACRRIARAHGWVAWKNEKNGNKGIPDSSFLHPDGRFYLIEFKKDAQQHPRPEQATWLARFPATCHLISSVTDFCALLGIKEE